MRGLNGRRIVVASGATGIGAATAVRLAAEGARLVVGDINDAALERTVAGIAATGGVARAVHYDLADAASISELVACCEHSYAGIDGLVAVGADVGSATLPRDEWSA
jgi:NAD(P)-dependent dehydrogenase (short-subunit alcohol dehydrogenase family)